MGLLPFAGIPTEGMLSSAEQASEQMTAKQANARGVRHTISKSNGRSQGSATLLPRRGFSRTGLFSSHTLTRKT